MKSRSTCWRQIFMLSAEQIAGAAHAGQSQAARSAGTVRRPGKIQLADRKVKVKRPRLRHKSEGEVKVPAYEKLRQDRGLGQHMLGALMRGVSTREYQEVLPQMARNGGGLAQRHQPQAIEASAEQLQTAAGEALGERRDSGDLHRWPAFRRASHSQCGGRGSRGPKHILGIEAGATENAAAVKRLLTHLRDQGLPTDRKYLFVIDGAKALRAGHRRSVRTATACAALPQPQTSQRPRRIAQRAAGPDVEPDAGRLESEQRRRR